MLQQHLRRQIIRSSRSRLRGTTFLLPFVTPSWQWTLSLNISQLFCYMIHEVAAHWWHFDFTASDGVFDREEGASDLLTYLLKVTAWLRGMTST